MKKDLNFDEVKEKKIEFLEQNDSIVLATSLNNRVTARTVNYVFEGLTILFASWVHLKKIAQIRESPKVALCRDASKDGKNLFQISMEGTAEIVGSPQDEESKRLIELYKKKLPSVYDFYFGRYPEEKYVFVKVKPTLIVSWVKKDDKVWMEYLDLEKRRAYLTTYFDEQEY